MLKFVVVLLSLLVSSLFPSLAANCTCYYDSDCAKGQYCNWQDACTRHCELQGTWDPAWGAPPQSTPDCDNWIGACHDNEPNPSEGENGDGENCEPPKTTNPTGGEMGFKMRDGVCNTRPIKKKPVQQQEDAEQVSMATRELVSISESGGGVVDLPLQPYLRDVMYNLALLAVGQYDFRSRLGGSPVMADVRGTCGPEVIATFGKALREEILRVGQFPPRSARVSPSASQPPRGWYARQILQSLSAECSQWVQSRPHNCQYPHPEAHHHAFDYEDGIHCLASNIGSMAVSLYED